MEAVLVRVLDLLGHSPILQALTSAVPLAIAVAGLAGWRAKVPHTLPLAVWGGLLGLWIFVPLPVTDPQLQAFRNFVSILCWLWLVRGWGRLVLTEWPAPIWWRGRGGRRVLLGAVVGGVVLIRGL